MLVILIATIWLGVLLFALTMGRLAARSDGARDAAIAEHLVASGRADQGRMATDGRAGQGGSDRRRNASARHVGYPGEELERDSSRIRSK
jgi:hypothetical protein